MKILDERERLQRQQHTRLIITEALMFLSVLVLVGFLTLVVMGYSFNLSGIGGPGEVVERSGLVQVSSIPTGAAIFIDGESPLLLNTNASRVMLAGEHEIALKRDGFDTWSKTISVTEGLMYRLNYPRLFKTEREAEEIISFSLRKDEAIETPPEADELKKDVLETAPVGEVSFVTISPNNERMILVQGGVLYSINLNENKPVQTAIELLNEESDVEKIKTISNAAWSGNSERLLAKVNDRWVVINVRDRRDTVWLGAILEAGVEDDDVEPETNEVLPAETKERVVISDIKFESEAGDRLLILSEKKELIELNIRDKKLSEVLLKNVEKFDNDGERVVYLTYKEVEKNESNLLEETATEDESGWQIRAYRMGEEEDYLIDRVELDEGEELGKVVVAVMRYFQEVYVGIARGEDFKVYSKTGWIVADDDLKEIFVEKIGFKVERIKKRGKGMVFELKNSDGEAKVFDIEAMKTVAVDTKNCGWIDEYLRYRLDPETGKLGVLDYDGLNERVLIEKGVLNGRLVAISGNNKFLYYFVKAEDGEKLMRERII